MGESLYMDDSEVPKDVLMWCSRSCNVTRMHLIGCAGMLSHCIAILATE